MFYYNFVQMDVLSFYFCLYVEMQSPSYISRLVLFSVLLIQMSFLDNIFVKDQENRLEYILIFCYMWTLCKVMILKFNMILVQQDQQWKKKSSMSNNLFVNKLKIFQPEAKNLHITSHDFFQKIVTILRCQFTLITAFVLEFIFHFYFMLFQSYKRCDNLFVSPL